MASLVREKAYIEAVLAQRQKVLALHDVQRDELSWKFRERTAGQRGILREFEIPGDQGGSYPRGYSVFRDIGSRRKTSHSAFLAQPRYSTPFVGAKGFTPWPLHARNPSTVQRRTDLFLISSLHSRSRKSRPSPSIEAYRQSRTIQTIKCFIFYPLEIQEKILK